MNLRHREVHWSAMCQVQGMTSRVKGSHGRYDAHRRQEYEGEGYELAPLRDDLISTRVKLQSKMPADLLQLGLCVCVMSGQQGFFSLNYPLGSEMIFFFFLDVVTWMTTTFISQNEDFQCGPRALRGLFLGIPCAHGSPFEPAYRDFY